MNNISIRDLETDRLIIKVPRMDEQYALWNILKNEKVNRYYFPTPDRIFAKNNLKKDNIADLKKARKIFLEQFNDWKRQKPFYEKKIEAIQDGENSQKFTWSIFLKSGEPIGQITCQPKDEYPGNPEIRDVGWFINPKYQHQGYGTEAAIAVLNFMFKEVEIEKIITSAAIINEASWKIMEKVGFKRTGKKKSTYFDDNDNILMSYCYVGDKENFINRRNIMNKFMKVAIDLSNDNLDKKDGGPFGACIVKDGKIIGKGANNVIKGMDPTAHAEITAIRDACKNIQSHDLSGCEIYTSCYPCPMCLSAIIWSNIKMVYYGNTKEDANNIGFRDEFIYDYIANLTNNTQDKSVLNLKMLNRDEAIEVFKRYNQDQNKIKY